MSQNHYQTVEYYPSSQPSNVSPMHSHPDSAKSVQVLDISHPVLYSPFDGRNYPAIVKKESMDERPVWTMDHCEKIVGCQDLNISVKSDPEWQKRDCNMEGSWMTSMELNKLPYDIGNRCDPKVPLNDIPVSPYLQVAERFVSELSNERPKAHTFGDSGVDGVSVGISMSSGLVPTSVMIRSDMADESSSLSINNHSKPSMKQRLLMVDESGLVPPHYADGLYARAVSTPVITGSHLGQTLDMHSSHNLSQSRLHQASEICHTPDLRRTPDLHHNPELCQTPNLSHPSSVGQNSDLSRSTDLSHDMHESSSLDESTGSTRNQSLSENSHNEKFVCDHCDKTFPTKHKLSLHKRTHRKKPPSIDEDKPGSSIGPSGSGERSDDVSDKRNSQEDLPFVCPACGRGFRMKMALACHMRYHAEERSYTCTDCGQAFTSRWARSPQLCDKCKHGPCAKPVPKPCKCDRCGKCFKDARLLRDHTRSHTGERPFVCPTCGKTFAQSGTLYRHKQVHSDMRPYRCSQCNKSYKLKGHLTVHMKSHTP